MNVPSNFLAPTPKPVLSSGQSQEEQTGLPTSPLNDPDPTQWLPAATLLRPQGRRGELLAEPLTDLPDVFRPGRVFRLAGQTITLQSSWRPHGRNASRIVLELSGIDSITAAEALAGQQLLLPVADLPALEPGAYLVRDLIGCALYDGDRLLGTITDLQFPIASDGHTRLPDAPDLLALEPIHAPPETEPVLVPFVKAWLVSVDLATKKIHMRLPPGLIEDKGKDSPLIAP